VGQVQVILALHDVVGELVAHRETEAIRFAVMTDDVEPGHFRFLAGILGKRRQRKGLARTHDDAAVALVEPFRLHTGLPCRRFAALHAPFEDAHGVGHLCFVANLLVHLVPRRGATQMREAGTADQQVRRVRVIQRWQDAPVFEQLRIVMTDAQAVGLYLLLQSAAGLNRGQREIAYATGVLHFADQTVVDHTDSALAVDQFELNQMHKFLL